MKNNFDTLLIIGRPASGKSEIIDFLKRVPTLERRTELHVGDFIEIDDFTMLWTWLEEDNILEQLGFERLHTDENNFFKHQYLWNLLIKRVCLEYSKFTRDNPGYQEQNTVILEFSRGKQHGGYKEAFNYIDPDILTNMAILFNDVSWEESFRKNKKRYNPDRPDSILEHGLSDEKMKFLYKEVDWIEITHEKSGYLDIQNVKVPFIVFDNEADITSSGDEVLRSHLGSALGELWELYQTK